MTKKKNFKCEKQFKSSRLQAKKKKTNISKRELYAKESQILDTCEELLETCDKLQSEISDYHSEGFLKSKKEINGLLIELSKETKENRLKTKRLSRKLKNVIQDGQSQFYKIGDPVKGKADKKSRFETVIFYSFLLFIVIILSTVLNGQSESGRPKNIGGYSPMTVLTRSMQSVYPQHSLVITKVTKPKELKLGEDITYIKENNTTVTHRIVGVNENYMGAGKRGFETKGVENPRKDEEVVRAENVIGKVVFSSLILGEILLFVQQNMIITAVTVILFIYLSDLLIKYSVTQWSLKQGKQKRATK